MYVHAQGTCALPFSNENAVTAYHSMHMKNLLRFWPPQLSEYKVTDFIPSADIVSKNLKTHEPISLEPLLATHSFQRYENPLRVPKE